MDKTKHIFSINLISWIIHKTKINPTYGHMIRNSETRVYAVFPDNDVVSAAIEEYQNNEDLQNFIANYKTVRGAVSSVRKSVDESRASA